jgi:hypothetical protein
MTRDDVANLVVRAIALWLGAQGVVTLASLPLLPTQMELPINVFTVAASTLPLVAGVVLWILAPRLAGAIFHRPDEDVRFEVVAPSVPSLASFVIGLFMIAGAIPQGAAWLGVLIMRSRTDMSLMSTANAWGRSVDEQGVTQGVGFLVRLVVGVILISNRNRFSAMTSDGVLPPVE